MIRDSAILVSHDAGGAELLSLWARENLKNAVAILDGPALSVFKKNIQNVKVLPFSDAMSLPYPVITGTSWQSDLEITAIKYALANNKYCCTVLDHWVNYQERFVLHDEIFAPNELWCFDEYALKLCQTNFPKIPRKLYANPYFSAIKSELDSLQNISKPRSDKKLKLLYLSESVDSHSLSRHGKTRQLCGYNEKDAFAFLYSCLPNLFSSIHSMTVRPHPSQTTSDLSWMNSYEYQHKFSISNESSLCEQILSHDIVIGLESMAMVVAIIANKPVFSAIPPNSKRCSIPYSQITHLSDLI